MRREEEAREDEKEEENDGLASRCSAHGRAWILSAQRQMKQKASVGENNCIDWRSIEFLFLFGNSRKEHAMREKQAHANT